MEELLQILLGLICVGAFVAMIIGFLSRIFGDTPRRIRELEAKLREVDELRNQLTRIERRLNQMSDRPPTTVPMAGSVVHETSAPDSPPVTVMTTPETVSEPAEPIFEIEETEPHAAPPVAPPVAPPPQKFSLAERLAAARTAVPARPVVTPPTPALSPKVDANALAEAAVDALSSPSASAAPSQETAAIPVAARNSKTREPESLPAESAGTWEQIVGGRWLGWAGAIALVVGAAFGMSYAINQGWIGPEMRIGLSLLGCVVGFVLATIAAQREYRNVAQVISAAAMGLGYLGFYGGAFWYYEMFSPPMAYVGMGAVTAAGLVFAACFDFEVTAGLGTLGGLLVPFLLNSGSDPSHVSFPYMVCLCIGVLIPATIRQWTDAAVVMLLAGVSVTWGWWYQMFGVPGMTLKTIGMPTLLYALIGGWSLAMPIALLKKPRWGLLTVIVVSPIMWFIALHWQMEAAHKPTLSLLGVGVAILYAMAYTLNQMWRRDSDAQLAMGITALLFAILSLPLLLTPHWTIVAWLTIAATLSVLGSRRGERRLEGFGQVLFWWAQIFLFVFISDALTGGPEFEKSEQEWSSETLAAYPILHLLHGRSLSFVANAVIAIFIADAVRSGGNRNAQGERLPNSERRRIIASITAFVAPIAIHVLCACETILWHRRFDYRTEWLLAMQTIWPAVIAAVVGVTSRYWMTSPYRWYSVVSIGLASCVLCACLVHAFGSEIVPSVAWSFWNLRIGAAAVAFVSFAVLYWVFARPQREPDATVADDRPEMLHQIAGACIVGMMLVGLATGTVELLTSFGRSDAGWIAVAAGWLVYAAAMLGIGDRFKEPRLLRSGGILFVAVQFVLGIASFRAFTSTVDPMDVLAALRIQWPPWNTLLNGRSLAFGLNTGVAVVVATMYRRLAAETPMSNPVLSPATLSSTLREYFALVSHLAAALAPVSILVPFCIETIRWGNRTDQSTAVVYGLITIWIAAIAVLAAGLSRVWFARAQTLLASALTAICGLVWIAAVFQTLKSFDYGAAAANPWAPSYEFGLRGLMTGCVIGAALVTAWILRHPTFDSSFVGSQGSWAAIVSQSAAAALVYESAAMVLGWAALSVELWLGYGGGIAGTMALTVGWTIYAAGLLVAGLLAPSRILRSAGLILFVLTTLKAFLYDIWQLNLLIRVIAFLLLGVTLIAVSWLYRRREKKE